MALQFHTNRSPWTAVGAVWDTWDFLTGSLSSSAWFKARDSDGSFYSPTGSQIQHSGSGARGWDNSKAWAVFYQSGAISQSDGWHGRSFCLQRNTTVGANTSYLWRIKYSKAGGFVSGSPTATVTPYAGDEMVVLGAGTDAAPTFASLFAAVTADGSPGSLTPAFRFSVVADNGTVGIGTGGSFMSYGWVNTTAATCMLFGLDAVQNAAAADSDPYAVWAPYGIGTNDIMWTKASMIYQGSYTVTHGWWITASARGVLPALVCADYVGYSAVYTLVSDCSGTLDGYDIGLPIVYAWYSNAAVPYFGGVKGWSGLVRYTSCIRYTGDLVSITGSRDGVVLKNCILPWDGSIPQA